MMLISLAVIVCAIGLALLIARYDLYDKEPWSVVLVAFGLGMLTGWVAGGIEDAILLNSDSLADSVAVQAAVASLTEELLKLLVVLAVAFGFARHFNDPLDGLIYGAYAGLGAAVEESWFSLSLVPDPSVAIIGTEAIRLLLHVFLGGLAGFGVGLARFRLPGWRTIFAGALSADLAIHFAWDFLCGIPAQTAEPTLGHRLAAVGLMLTSLALFGLAVGWGSRRSREILAPKSGERLWGWPFSLIFGERDR